MHPDKKVGLALGILLIGIVAALFFRNEAPDPDQNGPALANPQALDSRIRHKPHAPYLPDAAKPKVEVPSVPDGLVPDVPPQIPGSTVATGLRQTATVPEPIRSNRPRETDKSAPVPHPGNDLVGLDSALPQPRATNSDKPSLGVHEVAAGESLSSIAFKYLGTHKRYMEIYEANKDVLKGPNDLSVGMKLKIPSKDRSTVPTNVSASATMEPPEVTRATTHPSSSSTPTQQTASQPEEKSNEPASAKPLFVRPKSGQPKTPLRAGRSLTQSAPPGVPSLDGVEVARDTATAVIATKPNPDEIAEPSADKSEKTSAN